MPVTGLDNGPRKKAKINHPSSGSGSLQKDVADIQAALNDTNPENIVSVLNTVTQRLSINEGELPLATDDERLRLLQTWISASPGLPDLFYVWQWSHKDRNRKRAATALTTLATIISLLDTSPSTQDSGVAIIDQVLKTDNLQRLVLTFTGNDRDKSLTLATLRLFLSISDFGNGQYKPAVLEAFPWTNKTALLAMRRKDPQGKAPGKAGELDVRAAFTLLILSFLSKSAPTSVKRVLLTQGDVFQTIFRDFSADPYFIVRRVLDVAWEGIWSDYSLPWNVKAGAFDYDVLKSISTLYHRTGKEGAPEEPSAAEVAHHFLLAICTHPGSGVCFKSRGWYSRRFSQDEVNEKPALLVNKALAALVKYLTPNDNMMQQELVLRIMEAAPEVVPEYFVGNKMTLEPRLSSRWITNLSFVRKVLSLPLPTSSFRQPSGKKSYRPTPPHSRAIVDSSIPSSFTLTHMVKGLRSTSSLVRHMTASLIIQSLQRLKQMLHVMDQASLELNEGADGPWIAGRKRLLNEAFRKLPDFNEIVRLVLQERTAPKAEKAPQRTAVKAKEKGNTKVPQPHSSILHEAASRLMWYYQRLFGDRMLEGHTSMKHVGLPVISGEFGNLPGHKRLSAFVVLSQVHGLRLLKEMPTFDWTIKVGHRSAFSHILKRQATATSSAIRQASADLIHNFLSDSILFEHDRDEVNAWLVSMPRALRKPGALAPDGSPLPDEVNDFIDFLDVCLSRCLKTPYRYLEEATSLLGNDDARHEPSVLPSPLLFSILDQLRFVITKEASPSWNVLGAVTFCRKLVLCLQGKQRDMRYIRRLVDRLESIVSELKEKVGGDSNLWFAVHREMLILRRCVTFAKDDDIGMDEAEAADLNVESLIQGNVKYQAATLADGLRLGSIPETEVTVELLAGILAGIATSSSALSELLYSIASPSNMWKLLLQQNATGQLCRNSVTFIWALSYTDGDHMRDETTRRGLAEIFHREARSSTAAASHNTQAAMIRAEESVASEDKQQTLQSILHIVEGALPGLPAGSSERVKARLMHNPLISSICTSTSDSDAMTANLVLSLLSPESLADRALCHNLCDRWVTVFREMVPNVERMAPIFKKWIPFMDLDQLGDIFGTLQNDALVEVGQQTMVQLLSTVVRLEDAASWLRSRLGPLMKLLPSSSKYPVIVEALAKALHDVLPIGTIPHVTTPIDDRVQRAEMQWSALKEVKIPGLEMNDEFLRSAWTEATADVLAILVYRSLSVRETVAHWINSSAFQSQPRRLPVIRAFLDVCCAVDKALRPDEAKAVKAIVADFAFFCKTILNLTTSANQKASAADCVRYLLELLPAERTEFSRTLTSAIDSAPYAAVFDWNALVLLNQLAPMVPAWSSSAGPLSAAVEVSLKWVVRRFAEDDKDSEELQHNLEPLGALIAQVDEIKPYLAEPVLTAAIQNRLRSYSAMKFAAALVKAVAIKPVTVNKMIQSLVQHSDFRSVGSSSTASRVAIIDLLDTFFKAHPANTCQPNQVAPLIRIYQGTQSVSDRQLLSIFQLFERQRRTSVALVLSQWSSNSASTSKTPQEALASLTPDTVIATYRNFPQYRTTQIEKVAPFHGQHDQQYDPIFVLLLLLAALIDETPKTPALWTEIGKTCVLALAVSALSSKDDGIRKIAGSVLGCAMKVLQRSQFSERDQILFILNRTRSFIPAPDSTIAQPVPPRLPSTITLLLAEGLRCVFTPRTPAYPAIMRYLLSRPTFNEKDVPLINEMLYDGSDELSERREWMVRYLRDSMNGYRDWQILQRKRVWDLLAVLFQESWTATKLRVSILEVLLKLTCDSVAATSLVLTNGLLNWIESQLRDPVEGEETGWLLVLENVLIVVDEDQMENSTLGAWRSSIYRCLAVLYGRIDTLPQIHLASGILLRLATLKVSNDLSLAKLLAQVTTKLQSCESSVVWSRSTTAPPNPLPPAPHSSLPQSDSEPSSDWLWGDAIERLWRTSMLMSKANVQQEWEWSTSRLLLWTSLKRQRVLWTPKDAGEWARRAVIQNICGV